MFKDPAICRNHFLVFIVSFNKWFVTYLLFIISLLLNPCSWDGSSTRTPPSIDDSSLFWVCEHVFCHVSASDDDKESQRIVMKTSNPQSTKAQL